jgi:hypothetical protein
MEKYLQILISFNEKSINQIDFINPVFLEQYLLFKIEMVFLFLIFDIILVGVWDLNFKLYYKVKFKLVHKPFILARVYKSYQTFYNIISSIRPHYIRYGSTDKKELTDVIYADGLLKHIINMIISFFNPKYLSTVLALIGTIFFCYDIPIDFWVSKFFEVITIESLLSFLSFLPAIIVILIVVFGCRYTSFKGRYARGASRVNQRVIEETLDIHRRLVEPVANIIDKGAKNIEYALRCRKSLIKSRINKISPYIKGIEDNKVIWVKESFYNNKSFYPKNSYIFDNIEEIDDVVKIFEEAKNKNVLKEVFWIKFYNTNTRGIRNLREISKKLEEKLRFNLFTPRTLENLLNDDRDEFNYKEIQVDIPVQDKELLEKQIISDIKEFNQRLDTLIINGIEILVELGNYNKEVYRLLHFNSNRLSRTLSYWTDRE